MFTIYLLLSAVVLNLLLPFITLSLMAPPADKNSFMGQFYGMMQHHARTPFMSSILSAVAVYLAYKSAKYLKFNHF